MNTFFFASKRSLTRTRINAFAFSSSAPRERNRILVKRGPITNGFQQCHVQHSAVVTDSLPSQDNSESCDLRHDDEQLSALDCLAQEIVRAPSTRNVEAQSQLFCDKYSSLQKETRHEFLRNLSTKYGIEAAKAESTIKSFLAENKVRGEGYAIPALEKLRKSLLPAYMMIFNKVGRLSGGVKFLVDLRADILDLQKTLNPRIEVDQSALRLLKSMSDHLRNVLAVWFSVGLMTLVRITWDSPCSFLQKVSEYEAVHPLRNWSDLKRRVGPFRRCYVFTHSCLPEEPLVILHIALTKNISNSIQAIVKSPQATARSGEEASAAVDNKNLWPHSSETDPDVVDSAIFYSISSPQRGLHGIELGTQMIREVNRTIRSDFPNIAKFSSLSPIPGFREYLLSEMQSVLRGDSSSVANFIRPSEMGELQECTARIDEEHARAEQMSSSASNNGSERRNSRLWNILSRELRSNRWLNDKELCRLLYAPLMRKCAHYLYAEKRRAFALNSVAHFHLRNGAVMWRLNWQADLSPRGLANSCGIMINYRYYIEDMDKLAQDYIEERRIRASDKFLEFVDTASE